MAQPTTERRLATRIEPPESRRLSLNVSLSVQVFDISRSGVSLGSKAELRIGDRAQLRVTVASRSVSVTIEVRHVSVGAQSGRGIRYRAGAVFVGLSPEQRLLLDQLLAGERD